MEHDMQTNRPFISLAIVILLIVPVSCFARLGETEKESQERYGAPLNLASDRTPSTTAGLITRTYDYKGWKICTTFLNGRAVKLAYQKNGKNGSSGIIQKDESEAILIGEQGSGTWKQPSKATLNPFKALQTSFSDSGRWVSTNGNIAVMAFGRYVLTVESPALEKRIHAIKAQQELKRKKSIPTF